MKWGLGCGASCRVAQQCGHDDDDDDDGDDDDDDDDASTVELPVQLPPVPSVIVVGPESDEHGCRRPSCRPGKRDCHDGLSVASGDRGQSYGRLSYDRSRIQQGGASL